MIEQVIRWEDIGYTARIRRESEAQAYFASFELFEHIGFAEDGETVIYNRKGWTSSPDPVTDLDAAEVFVAGDVKWDGCADFEFTQQKKCLLHTCDRRSLANIGEALARTWDAIQFWLPSAFCRDEIPPDRPGGTSKCAT